MANSRQQRSIFDYLEGDIPKLVTVFKKLHDNRTPDRKERNLLRRSISKLTALQSQLRRRRAKKTMLERRRYKRSIEMLNDRTNKKGEPQLPLTGGPESILAKFLDTTYDMPVGIVSEGKASGKRRTKKNTRRRRKRRKTRR